MGRHPTREEVERRLGAAKTKREFDVVVEWFRRAASLPAEDRAALEEMAEAGIQRFATEAEKASGTRVRLGRIHQSFQNVLRGK